jgi:hypothetical protein
MNSISPLNVSLIGISKDARLIAFGMTDVRTLSRLRCVCRQFKTEVDNNVQKLARLGLYIPNLTTDVIWKRKTEFYGEGTTAYFHEPVSPEYRPSNQPNIDWNLQVQRIRTLNGIRKFETEPEELSIFQSRDNESQCIITSDPEGGFYALVDDKGSYYDKKLYGIRGGKWTLIKDFINGTNSLTPREKIRLLDRTHFAISVTPDRKKLAVLNLLSKETILEVRSHSCFRDDDIVQNQGVFVFYSREDTSWIDKASPQRYIHTIWNIETKQKYVLGNKGEFIKIHSFYTEGAITTFIASVYAEDGDTVKGAQRLTLDWKTLTLTKVPTSERGVLTHDRFLAWNNDKLQITDQQETVLFTHDVLSMNVTSRLGDFYKAYFYNQSFRMLFISTATAVECLDFNGNSLRSIPIPNDHQFITVKFWEHRAAIFFLKSADNPVATYLTEYYVHCTIVNMRNIHEDTISFENVVEEEAEGLLKGQCNIGILTVYLENRHTDSKVKFYDLMDMRLIKEQTLQPSPQVSGQYTKHRNVYLVGGLFVDTFTGINDQKLMEIGEARPTFARTLVYPFGAPSFAVGEVKKPQIEDSSCIVS